MLISRNCPGKNRLRQSSRRRVMCALGRNEAFQGTDQGSDRVPVLPDCGGADALQRAEYSSNNSGPVATDGPLPNRYHTRFAQALIPGQDIINLAEQAKHRAFQVALSQGQAKYEFTPALSPAKPFRCDRYPDVQKCRHFGKASIGLASGPRRDVPRCGVTRPTCDLGVMMRSGTGVVASLCILESPCPPARATAVGDAYCKMHTATRPG